MTKNSDLIKRFNNSYSDQDKIDTIILYYENGFNLTATAKQTGISTRTIRRWMDAIGDAILHEYERCNYNKSKMEFNKTTAIAHKNKTTYQNLGSFESKVHSTLLSAINRIRVLLDKEDDLKKINDCLKVIHQIASDFEPNEDGEYAGLDENSRKALNEINRLFSDE